MKGITVIVMMFSLMSCTSNQRTDPAEMASLTSPQREIEDKVVEEDSSGFKTLTGMEYNDALLKFGKPVSSEDYKLNQMKITEFRVGLLNKFSKEDLKKPIEIKEATWDFSDTENVTVWYTVHDGDWVPVDSFRWNKEAQF
jgi:hypothetical protein